ncbi:DUF6509 family protein [Jeotgalibacillus marinus]|uniref:DUF6509 family protein n=1 Tax=Jeotgalibacillus marinus TaxID=86667 RepID=A0ABV3Q4K2_9BACL
MITITEYSVDLLKDPFGILTGERYEFTLELDVPEDDELYSETGIDVRVLYRVEDGVESIVKYELIDKKTAQPLDFELETEELAMIESFCNNNLPKQ